MTAVSFLAPQVAYAFALVLFRTAGLVATAPLFGMRNAPAPVRLAIALALAMVTFLGAGGGAVPLPAHVGGLFVDALLETMMGVFAGEAARFALEAASTAGQLAGQTMGLGFGATLDPMSGVESTTLGELMRLLTMGAALAAGLHRELVLWLVSSVQQVPPGSVSGLGELARAAVLEAVHAIVLGVRLGFPFLAAVTLGNLTLGLLGRAAPQLNLSNVGFSMSLLFGGAALWFIAPRAVELCAEASLGFVGAH